MNIHQFVLQELQVQKGNWVKIATDNKVSYSWLTKLAQNQIPNPGVVTIQRLYDYLTALRAAA